MKNLFLILGAFVVFVLPTDIVQAVGPGNFVPCEGAGCTACHFIEMFNAIIFWVIGFLFLVFAVLLVIAGFKLVTSGGNPSARDEAKKKIFNALIGIVIVLAAWLLIDTLLKAILPGETGEIEGWGPWQTVRCISQNIAYENVREGAAADDPVQADVVPPTAVSGGLGDAEVFDAFSNAGIAVSSSGGCRNPANGSCTGLEGMRPATVNRTLELAEAVGAENVVVTGGTETGHSQTGDYRHDNGYKVDLRTTPALNSYIENNFESLGGNRWRDPNGNIYYRHGPVDHWDVTITN